MNEQTKEPTINKFEEELRKRVDDFKMPFDDVDAEIARCVKLIENNINPVCDWQHKYTSKGDYFEWMLFMVKHPCISYSFEDLVSVCNRFNESMKSR